tara:strand:+ start:817 stop:2118 length:1302 start_codon:yes stop_codon:yes gene_type:complete
MRRIDVIHSKKIIPLLIILFFTQACASPWEVTSSNGITSDDSNLTACNGIYGKVKWDNCYGTYTKAREGGKLIYKGEFRKDKPYGKGMYSLYYKDNLIKEFKGKTDYTAARLGRVMTGTMYYTNLNFKGYDNPKCTKPIQIKGTFNSMHWGGADGFGIQHKMSPDCKLLFKHAGFFQNGIPFNKGLRHYDNGDIEEGIWYKNKLKFKQFVSFSEKEKALTETPDLLESHQYKIRYEEEKNSGEKDWYLNYLKVRYLDAELFEMGAISEATFEENKRNSIEYLDAMNDRTSRQNRQAWSNFSKTLQNTADTMAQSYGVPIQESSASTNAMEGSTNSARRLKGIITSNKQMRAVGNIDGSSNGGNFRYRETSPNTFQGRIGSEAISWRRVSANRLQGRIGNETFSCRQDNHGQLHCRAGNESFKCRIDKHGNINC